jgi:hypothetical protein
MVEIMLVFLVLKLGRFRLDDTTCLRFKKASFGIIFFLMESGFLPNLLAKSDTFLFGWQWLGKFFIDNELSFCRVDVIIAIFVQLIIDFCSYSLFDQLSAHFFGNRRAVEGLKLFLHKNIGIF